MPGEGGIANNEKWVITITVDGARTAKESDALQKELSKLTKKLTKGRKDAYWDGKTLKKKK
jgi:hypothetical protein